MKLRFIHNPDVTGEGDPVFELDMDQKDVMVFDRKGSGAGKIRKPNDKDRKGGKGAAIPFVQLPLPSGRKVHAKVFRRIYVPGVDPATEGVIVVDFAVSEVAPAPSLAKPTATAAPSGDSVDTAGQIDALVERGSVAILAAFLRKELAMSAKEAKAEAAALIEAAGE